MQIRLEDHSGEVLEALDAACLKALEECGLVAEGYAKNYAIAPVNSALAHYETALHIW